MKFGGYENFPHQKDRLFPVINPEKRFYIIWEGMMLPFIAFAAIVTPTELAFYADVVPFWPLRDDVGSWTRFMWTFFALNRLVDLYARRRLLLRFSIIAAPPPRVRSRRRRGSGRVAAAAGPSPPPPPPPPRRASFAGTFSSTCSSSSTRPSSTRTWASGSWIDGRSPRGISSRGFSWI